MSRNTVILENNTEENKSIVKTSWLSSDREESGTNEAMTSVLLYSQHIQSHGAVVAVNTHSGEFVHFPPP